jgi:DNA-binding IclR family transcriptional regulator
MSADGNRALRKGVGYYRLLAGHELEGMRPGQIAKALGLGAATVTRDLRALKDEGVVELVPGMEDRWRLGPAVVQIALAHMHAIERMAERVSEIRQRYSREPK